MPTIAVGTKDRVVLDGVSWEAYQCMLEGAEGANGSRITYTDGKLEIMSPLFEHEEDNRILARIVEVLAEEWLVNLRNAGSLTLRREERHRGLEPDSSFYIQSLERIVGRRRIDITAGDPVPDLVIEVDITSPSLDKIVLYAEFGVSEVWLLRQDRVSILLLNGDEYQAASHSRALPRLTQEALNNFLRLSRTELYLNWLSAIRSWAREQSDD